jgi:hypothetical protein
MLDRSLSRRAVLFGSVGFGALLGLAGTASAMNKTPLAGNAELATAYANRCSATANGEHAQIMDQLQTMLASQQGAPGQTLTQTAYCPLCGCPIVATRLVP